MKNRCFYLVLLGLVYFLPTKAATKNYTPANIPTTIACNAGDLVTLANGTYTDKCITITGNGTINNPILVQAQQAGSVKFTGSSCLKIYGKYITVTGFYYETVTSNPIIEFRSSSSTLAQNCRVTNTAIIDTNTTTDATNVKWVSLYGQNNRVDHCHFQNKRNMGTLLVVWLESGVAAYHRVDANYFTRPLTHNSEENGQEVIRVGDSSTSMTDAYCVIENNVFEQCNGEMEVISNKSCQNVYYNNVFLNCNGTLTIRHGKNCTADGNYFLGTYTNSKTGGLRLIDSGHKAYNNYFQNLGGTNARAALCLMNGLPDSPINGYFPASNCIGAFNTFVNCKEAIHIGYDDGGNNTVVCENSQLANNVVNNLSSNSSVKVSSAGIGNTYSNNIFHNVSSVPSAFSGGYFTANPLLQQMSNTYNTYEPQSASPLASTYKTTTIADVSKDIKGKNRGNEKHPGCLQIKDGVAKTLPTKQNIGVSWINKENSETLLDFENATYSEPSSTKKIIYTNGLVSYSNGLIILNNNSFKGRLMVYTLLGVKLLDKKITDSAVAINLPKGMYIVNLHTQNQVVSQRLFVAK